MLAEAYCAALAVDERLADCVWKLWDAGIINDDEALSLWYRLSGLAEIHRGEE